MSLGMVTKVRVTKEGEKEVSEIRVHWDTGMSHCEDN